jgi:hypothetical protein
MLRQVQRGWLRRAVRFLRFSRVAAYLALACSGVAATLWPPASIAEASDGQQLLSIVWALLMTTAALFCAWGAARDRWVGEYIGLVPLAFVAAAFGVSAMARGRVGWAGGLFLIGFFWILVARWQEVTLLRVEADRQARDRKGEGESHPDEGRPA